MYITWKIVIDLHVYAWVQIHQIVNIKHVYFLYINDNFYKVVQNNKWVTFYEKYFYNQNYKKYFHMEVSCLDWFSTKWYFKKKYAVVYNIYSCHATFLRSRSTLLLLPHTANTTTPYSISSFLFLLSRCISWSFLYIYFYLFLYYIYLYLALFHLSLKVFKIYFKVTEDWRIRLTYNWYDTSSVEIKESILVPIFRML